MFSYTFRLSFPPTRPPALTSSDCVRQRFASFGVQQLPPLLSPPACWPGPPQVSPALANREQPAEPTAQAARESFLAPWAQVSSSTEWRNVSFDPKFFPTPAF